MSDLHSVEPNHAASMHRVINFFETLTVESAQQQLANVYAKNAYFKDPFNEVTGLDAITPLFTHMFDQVINPRFAIKSSLLQSDQAFMTWDFFFHMKHFSRAKQCIHGTTHFRFDAEGLVVYHRDYWDAAEELYEKLPVLGLVMRGLKNIARK